MKNILAGGRANGTMTGVTDIFSLRQNCDVRQSEQYGNFMEKIGWESTLIRQGEKEALVLSRKIGPASVTKIRRAGNNLPWPEIDLLMRKNRSLICRIDPENEDTPTYRSHGFKKDKTNDLGTRTLLLDLRPDEEKILAGFRTETRYKLRKTYRNRHVIEENKFEEFYRILKTGYSDLDVWCPPMSQYLSLIESFGKNSFALTVDGESGCLILLHKGVCEYYYAAATQKGKDHDLPYVTVWEAMKEAKKRGALVWDFNGMYDPRWPDPRWKGFSFFKTRFGGVPLDFAGSYTKYGWSLPRGGNIGRGSVKVSESQ